MPQDIVEAERLSLEATLKAAVHYTVGRICESMAEQDGGLRVSQLAVATISELVYGQACRLARDFEMVSRHARRTTVSVEDIILSARNSGLLHEYLLSLAPPPKKADAKEGSAKKPAEP
ncbi:centromere protein S-like [Amblyomma americanum]|uniref:Centromere protein S n=1 Tax=Amblyomma americanum TaxID=6943 RepID=A0AAQ4DVF8_AMBAM